jgi:hypothetical protein
VRHKPTSTYVKVTSASGNYYDFVELENATIMSPQKASSIVRSALDAPYKWPYEARRGHANYIKASDLEIVKVELEIKILP